MQNMEQEIIKQEHNVKRYNNIVSGIGVVVLTDAALMVSMANGERNVEALYLGAAAMLVGIIAATVAEVKKDYAERRIKNLQSEIQKQRF